MKTMLAILCQAMLIVCVAAVGCRERPADVPVPPALPPESAPLLLAAPGSEELVLFKLVILELPRRVGEEESGQLDIDKLLADRHTRTLVRRSFVVGLRQRNTLGSPEEASKQERPGLSVTVEPQRTAEGKIDAALDIYFADDSGRSRRPQGRWSCAPGKYAVLSTVSHRQDFFDRRGRPAGWSERTEIVAVLFAEGVLRD